MRVFAAGFVALLLAACVSHAPVPLRAGAEDAAACRALYGEADRATTRAGVRDAEAAPVPGFPYLRVNRLLASFRGEVEGHARFAAWTENMRALEREGREIELANLPAETREGLGGAGALYRCGDLLMAHDLETERGRALLKARALPPRHYNDWVRAAGLYPLSSIGVAFGFERWKAANLPAFEAPQPEGVTYGWGGDMPGRDAAEILAGMERDALGLARPRSDEVLALAALHAPVLSIEEASGDDRIGRAVLDGAGAPQIDTGDAAVYVRYAETRWGGKIRPQIVYTFWFPARPKQGAFDLLGGALDALTWRVTLGEDGAPLMHDTIHACGCYHLFFPVPPAARVAVPEDRDLREAPLVPQAAPRLAPGTRLEVHIAKNSHYVTGISVTKDVAQRSYRPILEMEGPAFGLRSLPLESGGRASFFGPEGIVEDSARDERFILWPMGIASAGAMRQWGTHATAFTGERHFDDSHLLEEAFLQ